MPSSTVRTSGPLFSGDHGRRQAMAFVSWIADDVSSFAIERVQANLDMRIKNPTPYYETQITITDLSYTDRSVNDRGVIYGSWLEGTGSRNQTTRFKGYWSFRDATRETEQAVPRIIESAARRFTAKMNGGFVGGY